MSVMDAAVKKAREPIHATVRRLAAALDVPFVQSDETDSFAAPEGAIGVLFYGMDRIGVVRYGHGGYQSVGFSGTTDAVLDACLFALNCLAIREG